MLRKASITAIGLVVLACYAVPYLALDRIASWSGAFLFWTLAGVAVIGLNVLATRGFARRTPDNPKEADR